VSALRDECERLRESDHEYEELGKLTHSILTRTANALKGEPEPLASHSWADLPEVATALRAEVEALRAARQEWRSRMGLKVESDIVRENEALLAEVDTLRIESGGLHQMLDGAQRENEALRAEVEKWRETARQGGSDPGHHLTYEWATGLEAEVERLRAEVERLRAEVERLREQPKDYGYGNDE
jgi:uncharacterized coiled-coil DUF342 family protein